MALKRGMSVQRKVESKNFVASSNTTAVERKMATDENDTGKRERITRPRDESNDSKEMAKPEQKKVKLEPDIASNPIQNKLKSEGVDSKDQVKNSEVYLVQYQNDVLIERGICDFSRTEDYEIIRVFHNRSDANKFAMQHFTEHCGKFDANKKCYHCPYRKKQNDGRTGLFYGCRMITREDCEASVARGEGDYEHVLDEDNEDMGYHKVLFVSKHSVN